jgi:hypothetical protein
MYLLRSDRGAEFQKKYPNVPLANSVEEALEGAFCCFIFTEWEEFVRLTPEVSQKNAVPLVYDGRNILDPELMKRGGGNTIPSDGKEKRTVQSQRKDHSCGRGSRIHHATTCRCAFSAGDARSRRGQRK